jgi:hypothetical protein
MATNKKLTKQGGEPAGNRIMKSVRLPVALLAQMEIIAAEQGIKFSDVAVNAIEKGLLRDSVLDLVRQARDKVAALNNNTELVTQVLGDIATSVNFLSKR